MAPTKTYFAVYQEYIDIVTCLGEIPKSSCFQGHQINKQNFHYSVVTPLIGLLIKETNEALFDVKDSM